jgi:hypothetical protein
MRDGVRPAGSRRRYPLRHKLKGMNDPCRTFHSMCGSDDAGSFEAGSDQTALSAFKE